MHIIIDFLTVLIVLDSLLMVLLILMQRPKSEGLGASFGGGMTNDLFGAQTTNVLQKATRVMGGVFFGLALILSMLYSRTALADKQSQIQQQLANAPAPKDVKVVDVPVDANVAKMNADQLKAYMMKLAAAKGVPMTGGTASGTSAATGTNSKTGATPASPDAEAPSLLQLGIPQPGTGGSTDDTEPSKLQLQTGTAAMDPFQTGTDTTTGNKKGK